MDKFKYNARYLESACYGPVTVNILLVPTPPTDYVASHFFTGTEDIDNHESVFFSGVPRYRYRYKVALSANGSSLGATPRPPEDKVNGIVKFDDGSGWWPVKCTCIANLLITTRNDLPACFEPTIDGVQPSTLPEPFVICFSGETRVVVKGRGPRLLKEDVNLGDYVLVGVGKY